MKTKVKIVSFSVLQNGISIRLMCWNSDPVTGEAKDEKRRITLDELSFEAKIRSINIQREGTNILLRTRKSRYLVNRLFELMDKLSLDFSVTEVLDKKLSELLLKVSEKLNEPQEKLLERLTRFKDKDGNEIAGKKSIDDLTEGQKSYVLRRLSSMLKPVQPDHGEESSCLVS
jgi:hypothetical protein